MGRPQLNMTKMWQMMQSRDTKNLNLDKDFEDRSVVSGAVCSKLHDGRHNVPFGRMVLC